MVRGTLCLQQISTTKESPSAFGLSERKATQLVHLHQSADPENEDADRKFLRNSGIFLQVHTALQPIATVTASNFVVADWRKVHEMPQL
jgi:hypothetical protein